MEKRKGKKRGPAPKPASEAKQSLIQLRVNEADKAEYERAAALDSRTLSSWIRNRLLRMSRQELEIGGATTPNKIGGQKMRLDVELDKAGCDMTPETFREMVSEHRRLVAPAWSDDDLICHPDEARKFAADIRLKAQCPQLSDYMILKTLINVRKKGSGID